MEWKFAAKGDPVLISSRQALQHPREVTDPFTEAVHPLKFLSPYTAHKTLGHYKEPAGTQMEQFQQLWKISDKSTEFLWKCHLTTVEAWTFYCACYLPSIGYPLSCSSLNYPQFLDRVQRTATRIIVAKCGFNRHSTKRGILWPNGIWRCKLLALIHAPRSRSDHHLHEALTTITVTRKTVEMCSRVDTDDSRNIVFYIPTST
jgi:hypothetical protein